MYRRFAKHERGTIIVYVASIILAILFAIAYDIKLEAVLYYIGLVTEVAVIYLIISFIMYARKVKQLEKYSNNINIFNNNILIKKTDDIEEKYGDIIDKLYNQINNEISEKDKKIADNKQKVCLVIEDEGIGISKEDILRVFDNGYTGLNGRRDKKASGIGLYLTKIVCDALNHKIDIESEPGKGTRVSIHLNIALRSA